MPHKIKRPCSHPGCRGFAEEAGRCKAHHIARYKAQDEARGSSAERGYDGVWRRARALHLAAEPLCRECGKRGRLTAAVEVDHIVPIAVRSDLRLDDANLQSLCKPCHSRKTMRESVAGTWGG